MTTSSDTELIRRLEHALTLLECATSGGPPDLIPRPSTLLAEARARLAQPEPKFAFTNLAARPLLEKVAHMADCIGQQTVAEIAAISSQAAAWLRENPPGQPVAIEPRGCPTPGACSCVEPAALAQPEPEGLKPEDLPILTGKWRGESVTMKPDGAFHLTLIRDNQETPTAQPEPEADEEAATLASELRHLISEYQKMRGLDPENIYSIHQGDPTKEAHLRISRLTRAAGLLDHRVGHILRLAEIIREVDGRHDKGAAALAEAILSHPGSRWMPTIKPVPVAERPWERECGWLDLDGECWWCPPDGPPYWQMANPAMVYAGWLLPARAMPIPSTH